MELTVLEQKIMNLTREGEIITINTLYKLNEIFKFAEKDTIKENAELLDFLSIAEIMKKIRFVEQTPFKRKENDQYC